MSLKNIILWNLSSHSLSQKSNTTSAPCQFFQFCHFGFPLMRGKKRKLNQFAEGTCSYKSFNSQAMKHQMEWQELVCKHPLADICIKYFVPSGNQQFTVELS